MSARCPWLVGVVVVCLLGAFGCGRESAGDAAGDPKSSARKKVAPAETPDCCDVDRAGLLARTGGEKAADEAKAAGKVGTESPMFGGTPARNMVNPFDKGIPTDWSVEDGKFNNVKWAVKLGNKAYGGPVIAGGRVYVGTNNNVPRDPAVKDKKKAVLMCFSEADGSFLWQAMHDIPADEIFSDIRMGALGLLSSPAVDGDRVYYVVPGGEVIAADAKTGKDVWRYDMRKELKVHPFHCCNCSPLVVGSRVFLVTSNGTDGEGKVPAPKAPSFIALDKNKGTLLWQSNLPGDGIIEGQWSNPTYAEVNGKGQVIFPGGDCWLYSLDPEDGKLIWKFNCDPQRPKGDNGERPFSNYIVATPVVYDSKVHIALGVYPEHAQTQRFSYVVCVDVTKKGDVSAVDLNVKNPKNKDSALVWAFGGPINPKPAKGRAVYFGSTISTCAVQDGLVYITEERGFLHCLDAKTGKREWDHDFLASIWGSPYWVDGKIYFGTEDGEVLIFAHGKQKAELGKISMEETVQSTPVVANGVLYVMTRSRLYAIAKGGTAKEAK
jgi:outer membrane protein assembly factor BamB